MLPDDVAYILILISLAVAVAVNPLAYIAKHRWRNKRLTQGLSVVGVIATLIFIILVWPYIPD